LWSAWRQVVRRYSLLDAMKPPRWVTAVLAAGTIRINGERRRGVINAAIKEKIAEPERWKGKKCRLHMEFAQDGRALKVSTSNGDKGYC